MLAALIFMLVVIAVCSLTMVFKAVDYGDAVSYTVFLFISSVCIAGIIFLLR